MLHAVMRLSYFVHIGGGFVGLVSGSVALLAPKGRLLHRIAGNVFFVSMLLMAVFAIHLAFAIPNELINAFIGTFALYLVGTGWQTVRRKQRMIGPSEKIALLVSLCLAAPFVGLTFSLAVGLPALMSGIPDHGPELIALYCFTLVLVIATVSDAKILMAGGISGSARIARHLWRMCLGLTLAAGSGFTNGFARLLPGPYHVPTAFFVPTFVPLVFMTFWIIRVRFTPWQDRGRFV